MAKFIMRQMGEATGKSAGKRYPHLLHLDTVSLDEVAELAAEETTFGKAEIKGAFGQLVKKMAFFLAQGCSVRLDGFGTLRPLLRLKEGAQPEAEGDATQRSGASVRVGSFSFKPDKDFLFETNIRATFERITTRKWKRPDPLPEAERRAALTAFLAREGVATVGDYCRLTGLHHTAAAAELRALAREENPIVRRHGSRSTLVYLPAGGEH